MNSAAAFPVGASVSLEELEGDLHRVTARLRHTEPVSWLPCIDGWFVTSRELAIAVMRYANTYTVEDPRFTTGQVVGPSMLSLDGDEHSRHRAPFVDPYRPANLGELAAWIEHKTTELISRFEADGPADLRAQLAAPLAAATIHRSLGLVDTSPEAMLSWYTEIVAAVSELSVDAGRTSNATAAMDQLRAAVEGTIQADPESLVAKVSGAQLDDAEVAQNVAIVMFGAIETAEATIANAVFHLLSNQDELTRVRDDQSLLPNALEESLRLEPAASVVDRYATTKVSLGDAHIEQGSLVRVSLAGANRDPSSFTDPDRFDVTRPNSRQHVTFAQGPHACLGAHLARLETTIAVTGLLNRFPKLQASDPAEPPTGLIFRKPSRLLASWT